MIKRSIQSQAMEERSAVDISYPLGFWSAVICTAGGVIYFVFILGLILTGGFTFPPSEATQLFGGIISFLLTPVIVILMACLHAITPPEKRALSLISLGFTLLFSISVSINRFAQLGVVRQSQAAGNLNGIEWFLAYGDHSVMFAMEILGWAWFLGLAMLAAAPLFGKSTLGKWIRGLMLSYGGLGLICAVAHLLGSPLAVIGFAAWGLVLYIITGLLGVYFKRVRNQVAQAA